MFGHRQENSDFPRRVFGGWCGVSTGGRGSRRALTLGALDPVRAVRQEPHPPEWIGAV